MHSELLLRIHNCLHELRFAELLSGHIHDSVDFAYHKHGVGVLEPWTGLDEVVHVVAVESGISCHERTVALALGEFIDLMELHLSSGVEGVDILFCHELIVMELREENGVDGIVHTQSEATFGSDVTQLLEEHALREIALELLHVDAGVAALHRVHNHNVRPDVLREHSSVFGLQFPQFGSPLRVRLEPGLDFSSDFRLYFHLVGQSTVLNVSYVLVEELVTVVLKLYDGGRVSGQQAGNGSLNRHTHQDIVLCGVVSDIVNAVRIRVEALDEARGLAAERAGNGTVYCAVSHITLHLAAHNVEETAVEHLRTVQHKVVEPQTGHLAVNVVDVFVRHRAELRLVGGAGCGCIHSRPAREEDIGLSVFVPLDHRTEELEILGRHVLSPQCIEFIPVLGCQNFCKPVFLTEFSVFGIFQNPPQRLFCRLFRVSASLDQPSVFYFADQTYSFRGYPAIEFFVQFHLNFNSRFQI